MFAVYTELDVPEGAPLDVAREVLNSNAVPQVTAAGATNGYWLAPQGGRSVSVVLFDDEATARQMAGQLTVGGRPQGAPEGVAFRTVEVREVLAQV
jgi:hypothetical protein